jgi:hypothetical protein
MCNADAQGENNDYFLDLSLTDFEADTMDGAQVKQAPSKIKVSTPIGVPVALSRKSYV